MTTYVLVHGAWHGGWCWRKVRAALGAGGADVRPHKVTLWRALCIVVSLAMLSSPACAAESDATRSVVAKLAQTGEVSCLPTLPSFCSNMHVSCAGQTSIKSFPFKLKANLSHGTIESAPETESLRIQYENGRLEWDKGGMYVILLPRLASGYIKLLADGTYSFRHYAQHIGAMSIGRCS